jgi:hypothetical protein
VEVKIGVTHANRELVLESSKSADEIKAAVSEALADGSGLLELTDDKGRTIYIPAAKLAYVEIVGETSRRLGFAG